MGWSSELQELRDSLLHILLEQCREEAGSTRSVSPETDPCHDLGICDGDMDDLQIAAAAKVGLRLPYPGEPLIIRPEGSTIIADLAAWLAVNGRPLNAG